MPWLKGVMTGEGGTSMNELFYNLQRFFSRYYLKDRNSPNGVRVNNIMIDPSTPHKLRDGDKVTIGTIDLTFQDETHTDSDKQAKDTENDNTKLVTILPSEKRFEETMTISAELEADTDLDFRKVDEVRDVNTLREDYEKLRLAYELSKISLTNDITPLLAKSMDLMFEILPVDRGVVLLVDENTGNLSTHYVKLREGKSNEGKEILLSSTILRKVSESKVSVITRDAFEDPMLGKAASVKYGQIRSVICVPLIAHNKVCI
jgi:adenylate cyclase